LRPARLDNPAIRIRVEADTGSSNSLMRGDADLAEATGVRIDWFAVTKRSRENFSPFCFVSWLWASFDNEIQPH
jgi:hypothetical protein